MRHFFFCLLIALTALRGWVGDAMAIEMVQPPVARHVSAASETQQAHPCHGATQTDNAHEAAPAAEAQNTCFSCQVCHLNALVHEAEPLPASRMPAKSPERLVAVWHSASLEQSIKPPIY